MVRRDDVIEKLEGIQDPELGMDIWSLGLIYEIDEGEETYIEMTFTTPFCPYGPALVEKVEQQVGEVEGIEDVEVEVTMDPPWEPPEDLKAVFGFGGPGKDSED